MSSVSTDRRLGLVGSVAYKPPVDCATTANITLSGEQTIDGVTTNGSRVLVKNQTDATTNGIYDSNTGTWTRSIDSNGNYDFRNGTLVSVNGGSVNGRTIYQVTSSNPITIGTTAITWGLSLTNSGSSVSFTPAGTGAVARTMQAKARDIVSVKDFGAAGNGVTDDSTAIQAAINSFGAGPISIFLPAGDYLLSTAISLSTAQNVYIVGAGNGSTRLICNANNAFLFSPSSQNVRISISKLDIVANVVASGSALSFTYPAPSGVVTNQIRVEDVDIYGASNSFYFTTGISCVNSADATIWGCMITGQGGNPLTIPSAYGIYIQNCYDVFINECRFVFWQYAVYVYDYAEGVNINQVKVDYCDYGFYKLQVGGIGVPESLQLVLTNSHITARKRGAVVTELKGYFLSNLHIQCRDDAASPIVGGSIYGLTSFVAVEVQGVQTTPPSETDMAVIENVSFYASTTFNDKTLINGITAEFTANLRIRDSWFANCALGLWLQANSTQTYVNDVRYVLCTANTLDSGTNNVIQQQQYTATLVHTLTGGAATENFDIALPTGMFSAKPNGGFVFVSDPVGNYAWAFYDFASASSTATNARCSVIKRDGTNLPAATWRFSALFFGS